VKSRTKKVKAPPATRARARGVGPGRPCNPPDLGTERGRFGARLRAAREATGLSMADAAGRAGATLDAWSNWESGRNFPRRILPLLPLICDTLACDLEDLIPEAD